MITVSLCMIVKNEEDVIERCLESVQSLFDEIIIVDTGSSDKTVEIINRYTPHVYYFKWIDDFSAARNFAFSKATQEYVMWLDADDIMLEEDKTKFLKLKSELDPSIDMVMMKYHVGFDAVGQVTLSYYRERLFKRSKNYQWIGAIHEVIPFSGNMHYTDIAICHHKLKSNEPQRNLNIFKKMIANGKTLDLRQQFYYARELYFNENYGEAITIFNQFLNTPGGWVENYISACQNLSSCYHALGKDEEALATLFKTFAYDSPRAEICCDIGRHFFDRSRFKEAIFWYELATAFTPNETSGAFIQKDCYDFTPYLQLCVCYFRLGDLKTSIAYHEKTLQLKPEHPTVQFNKNYFESLNKN